MMAKTPSKKTDATTLPHLSKTTDPSRPETPTPSPSPESGPPSSTPTPSTSEPVSDGSHLDDIPVEEPEASTSGNTDQPAASTITGPDGFLTRDAFFAAFVVAHQLAGQVAGLKTLIEAPKGDAARPASDALYDTCRDVPMLHFLIQPGGIWFQRAAVVAAYALPVAAACQQELRARRARPVEHPESTGNTGQDPLYGVRD